MILSSKQNIARIIYTPTYFVRASNSSMAAPPGTIQTFTCDGTADEVEINLALALGDVVLSDGAFNCATSQKITGANSLIGQGQDRTTINVNGNVDGLITIGGSKAQLGGSGNAGNNVISSGLAGDTALSTTQVGLINSINVNDYLSYGSNEIWNQVRGQYTKNQWIQVASKTGGDNFTITKPLRYDIVRDDANSIFLRLYKYTLVENKRVAGFKVQVGATAYTGNQSAVLLVQYVKNCQIQDVFVDGNVANKTASFGIAVLESLNVNVENCKVYYIENLGISGQTGYGIYFRGSEYCICSNCSFLGNKHNIDDDKANWMPISYRNKFQYMTFGSQGNTGSNNRPASNHGGAEEGEFAYLHQIVLAAAADTGLHIGFIVRGPRTKIHHCSITAEISGSYCSTPLFIGEDISIAQGGVGNNGDGLCCVGTEIYDNVINISRIGGSSFTNASQGNFINLKCDAQNVKILRNVFSGLQNTGVLIQGNNNFDIEIANNDITFNTQRSGEKIVNIAPQFGSNVADDVQFDSNTVANANDTSSPYVKSTYGITNYSEPNNSVA